MKGFLGTNLLGHRGRRGREKGGIVVLVIIAMYPELIEELRDMYNYVELI